MVKQIGEYTWQYFPETRKQKFERKFGKMFKIAIRKTIYKWWRDDLQKWEEKKVWFGLFVIYNYSIFKDGKFTSNYTLKAIPNSVYMKKPTITKLFVGQKYLREECKGSKWQIPTNYTFDPNFEGDYEMRIAN